MKHVALVLFVLACQNEDKKPPAPPPPPPTPSAAEQCTAALASFDRFVDTGDPSATPEARATIKSTVHARCVADRWSDAALVCMRAATTSQEVFACWNQQLTKEQRDAASKALGSLQM